jgi:hypothetical protein
MAAATTVVKTLLVEDPARKVPDLEKLLTKQGHELSSLVVAVTRSEFLRSVRFLQDRKLLKRNLV